MVVTSESWKDLGRGSGREEGGAKTPSETHRSSPCGRRVDHSMGNRDTGTSTRSAGFDCGGRPLSLRPGLSTT